MYFTIIVNYIKKIRPVGPSYRLTSRPSTTLRSSEVLPKHYNALLVDQQIGLDVLVESARVPGFEVNLCLVLVLNHSLNHQYIGTRTAMLPPFNTDG